MGDESQALQEQLGWGDADVLDVDAAEQQRAVNRQAKVGTVIECPTCGRRFTKRSYQQVFCSNKGRDNCKDRFWNRADPDRLDRARAWVGE